MVSSREVAAFKKRGVQEAKRERKWKGGKPPSLADIEE